jgi:hypothetical protein
MFHILNQNSLEFTGLQLRQWGSLRIKDLIYFIVFTGDAWQRPYKKNE